MAANLDMTLPDGEDAAAGTDIKGGLKHVSMTVDNVCNSSIYRRYDATRNFYRTLNPLTGTGNYSSTSNNTTFLAHRDFFDYCAL